MRYLDFEQLKSQLNAGRTVEQWLGHFVFDSYRTLKWLQIEALRPTGFGVRYSEVFDEGDPQHLDVYSFEALDPDRPDGILTEFASLEECIRHASEEYGAQLDRYVGHGILQEVYRDFLKRE
jgi:hypothetical protein